ncbi:hypothetical protein [Caulobacter sp. S45]|uniref:hypothetical protein n=1 Tax=Caulobacter sp. S45 TaxID=1641861 RepID=UPI001575D103|nr:hypothetical protein [Caulobacter sp. S45]
MLKQLLQRATFEVVGIVALAVAAGVAVISAAYGLYALLRTSLSAAASAALTSLGAIMLIAVLAVVLIQLAKKRPAPHDPKARRFDQNTMQQALSVGAALTGVLADVILQWRLEHRPDKHDRRGRGKRR